MGEYFFELMKSEWERLATFNLRSHANQWPLAFLPPEELANAGFFYLLSTDRVQCAFCRGVVCGWEPGDRPLAEHARHFPRCPFIMEEDVGNVPIGDDPIRAPKRMIGQDVCGNWPLNGRQSDMVLGTAVRPGINSIKELGVQPHHGPKNPNYSSIDARRSSFLTKAWDHTKVPVTIDQLAEAGFFCIGMSDYVKCFHCDGGLCNWESGDDPWTEHARWLPDCAFLQLNKGPEFIGEVRRTMDNNAEQPAATMNNGPTSPAASTSQKSGDPLAHPDQETTATTVGIVDEEAFAIQVVDNWLRTPMVGQLVEMRTIPIDVIRAVLDRRWRLAKRPFETFEQLLDAAVEWRRTQPLAIAVEASSASSSEDSELSSQTSTLSSPASCSPPESSLVVPNNSGSSRSRTPSPTSDAEDPNHRLLCKICLDREIAVVFLPCGHQLTCTRCAPCVSECPVCRKMIRGTVRTFFS